MGLLILMGWAMGLILVVGTLLLIHRLRFPARLSYGAALAARLPLRTQFTAFTDAQGRWQDVLHDLRQKLTPRFQTADSFRVTGTFVTDAQISFPFESNCRSSLLISGSP